MKKKADDCVTYSDLKKFGLKTFWTLLSLTSIALIVLIIYNFGYDSGKREEHSRTKTNILKVCNDLILKMNHSTDSENEHDYLLRYFGCDHALDVVLYK